MERAPRRPCSLQARVLILGLLITLLTPAAWAQILTGRVVGVTDGDTITVLDEQRVQHKIRLAGIDAPEKSQAFGQLRDYSPACAPYSVTSGTASFARRWCITSQTGSLA